jgi:fatty acid desaturase
MSPMAAADGADMAPDRASHREPGQETRRWRGEWPTWAVVVAAYAGWLLVTWHYHALPWWMVLPLGAWLVAWQNSFQHEAVHGHPTPWRRFNDALATPPLGLWMPYADYRETHLRHHDADLTSPSEDPESYYLEAGRWRSLTPLARGLLVANNTLLGRLVLGPALTACRYWAGAARRLVAGDREAARLWLGHLVAVAVVMAWVVAVCDIPVLAYVLLFAYPGLSLTLTRSYLEHRPATDPDHRTVIVEGGRLAALLYLNNNLHAAHHRWPGMAWYRLPAAFRAHRRDLLSANGGYRFAGYRTVAWRYLVRPKDIPVHPGDPVAA